MAITTIQPGNGRYYDVNRDEYYDSHAQYIRHMEQLRIAQMRQADLQRSMYAAQQQMGHMTDATSGRRLCPTVLTLWLQLAHCSSRQKLSARPALCWRKTVNNNRGFGPYHHGLLTKNH